MRIAYIIADRNIPVIGTKGASIHVQQIVRGFAALGHDVDIICAEAGIGSPAFDAWVHEVRADDVYYDHDHVDAKTDQRERQALADSNALRNRLLALAEERPFDLIYERFTLFSRAGLQASRALGIPLVIELNSPLRLEQKNYRKLVHDDEALAVEREVLRGADRVVAVSDPVGEFAVSAGARADQVIVLPNAVDPLHFCPPPADSGARSERPFTIGFTGSLKPWHGLEYLLLAVRSLRMAGHHDLHLTIVGKGPMREWIEGFVAGAGLDGMVSLPGWIDYNDLPEVLSQFDVAVAPYGELEGFYFSPLKIFEYMAMGLPVIASDIGQISDIVLDERSGLLVDAGNPEQLAAAILRLRDDAELRRTLGIAARAQSLGCTWQDNAARAIEGLIRRAAA